MTSTVWVTEKYTCPNCEGTGWGEGRVIEGDEYSLPTRLFCPTCLGSGETIRSCSMDETEFWREFLLKLERDMKKIAREHENRTEQAEVHRKAGS